MKNRDTSVSELLSRSIDMSIPTACFETTGKECWALSVEFHTFLQPAPLCSSLVQLDDLISSTLTGFNCVNASQGPLVVHLVTTIDLLAMCKPRDLQ